MLEFALYGPGDVFLCMLTPNEARVELLWNAVSSCELKFDDDAPVLARVVPGTRVRVFFTPVGLARFEVMRGWFEEDGRTGEVGERVVTFLDDFSVFANLGWQSPTSPISTTTAVTQPAAYKRYTGPTETVVRDAIRDMSNRLGLGLSAGSTTGAGRNRRVEFRMHPLVDKLLPLLIQDKLTLTVVGSIVNVQLRPLFPRVLTPDSGVLGDYEWTRKAPTATRVVVGGEGEAAARLFQRSVDGPTEAEWGFVREVFKDSRMAQGVTDLSEDAEVALAEGQSRVSFSAKLNETSWFRFGTYRLGDRVSIAVPGLQVTDVIRQVAITDTPQDGLVVTPTVGEFEDSGRSDLGRKIAALARSVRDQGRQ